MCTQKKERDEMTGHEAREDMKEKKREEVCKGGKRMKRGNKMEGTGTDETKLHHNDLGKPASFECTRCMCAQGLDRFQ